jgi:hypothetical protein
VVLLTAASFGTDAMARRVALIDEVELTDLAIATNCRTDSNRPTIVSGSARPTHYPDKFYSNRRHDIVSARPPHDFVGDLHTAFVGS